MEFIKLSGLVNSQIELELKMGNGTLTKPGEISQKNLSKILDIYSNKIQSKGFEIVDFTKYGLGKAVLAGAEYDELKKEISNSARVQPSQDAANIQARLSLEELKAAVAQLEEDLSLPNISEEDRQKIYENMAGRAANRRGKPVSANK